MRDNRILEVSSSDMLLYDLSTKFSPRDSHLIVIMNTISKTYDIWTVKGPSAYTGGLWLASLSAAAAIAKACSEHDKARTFLKQLQEGKRRYEELLWTGR